MWIYLLVTFSLGIPVTQQQHYEVPTVWNVNQYPDPRWDYVKCGREKISSVCDPNGLIPQARADEIDRLIADVHNDTRCLCYDCVQRQRGYIIRVALMTQTQKILNNTDDGPDGKLKDAQLFAYLLTQKWNLVGSCNETILILFSKNDEVVYTLTGQHAKLKLRDSNIAEVSINTRHYFSNEETIADGIKAVILGYKSFLKGEEYKPYHTEETTDTYSHGINTSSTCFLLMLSLLVFVL